MGVSLWSWTWAHSVAHVGLELMEILLSQPPDYCDYGDAPPCPAGIWILNDQHPSSSTKNLMWQISQFLFKKLGEADEMWMTKILPGKSNVWWGFGFCAFCLVAQGNDGIIRSHMCLPVWHKTRKNAWKDGVETQDVGQQRTVSSERQETSKRSPADVQATVQKDTGRAQENPDLVRELGV